MRLRNLRLPYLLLLPSPATYTEHTQCHSFTRRQKALNLLSVCTAIEPTQTRESLRLARNSIRQSLSTIPPDTSAFLRYSLKDAVLRAIASAAGGMAAAYVLYRIVLTAIPLVPSRIVTRFVVGGGGGLGGWMEVGGVSDLVTVELLLMPDNRLAETARCAILKYDPNSLLVQTIDRHTSPEHSPDYAFR